MKKDLTDSLYQRFAKRAKLPDGMDKMQVLENLNLIRNGSMTNAGAWLLAENIMKFNSAGNVSCALFQGSTKTHILDRKDYDGDVFSMIQDAVVYIMSKINTELIIKHVKREERPELPEEAVREVVVNAFAHRDYRSTANVQIYVFKDRVEIVNPGGLPAGMTPELLGRKSIPRNPLLFSMLYRMDAVEHVGSGWKRIRNLCVNAGVDAPVVEVDENWFTVTFKRYVEQADEGAQSGGRARPESWPEWGPESGPESIYYRVMVALIEKEHSKSELANTLGHKAISGTLNQRIRQMLQDELIEYTIPDKPTSRLQKYRLTEKGRALLKGMEKEDRDD